MAGNPPAGAKRLLVLGAGPGQLGLLEAARARDLYVIAADRNPAAPGFRFADRRRNRHTLRRSCPTPFVSLMSSGNERALSRTTQVGLCVGRRIHCYSIGPYRGVAVKVAVIGLGYWGPNLVRNLHATDAAPGVVACDVDEARVKAVIRQYPGTRGLTDYADVLSDPYSR